jgi:manganese/zinc/iron transport system ATP- binding protein
MLEKNRELGVDTESYKQYAISLENVTVSYDTKPAIIGITLDIPPGQVVGIVGPNGAGKTTLLKAIMKLLPLDRGRILIFGNPVEKSRRLMAYVPQKELVDWDYPIVVSDVVMMGRYPHIGWIRRPRKVDYEVVDRCLKQVEMSDYKDRQIGELSGGQQQRVFLARALAQEAQILLLDEPFVGVDAATEQAIFSLMRELKSEGKTVLVVNHDLGNAINYYDSLILINQRLVAYGPAREVFTPELLRKTYGGRLAILESLGQRMVVGK